MPDLVVIVPSRGRPQAAVELAHAFAETCTGDTALVFAVDEDDPTAAEYGRAFSARTRVELLRCPSKTMVEALNFAATLPQAIGDAFAIGFLGDDHRPRTVGWDKEYVDALRVLGTGIVYGNDLLQRRNLPTQCAMTADIVRLLGWMAPPDLRHLYVDNFWRDLGQRAACLRYLPDVIVEHMHPVAGKAAVDEGYARVNAPEVYRGDEATYRRFVDGGFLDMAVSGVLTLAAAS